MNSVEKQKRKRRSVRRTRKRCSQNAVNARWNKKAAANGVISANSVELSTSDSEEDSDVRQEENEPENHGLSDEVSSAVISKNLVSREINLDQLPDPLLIHIFEYLSPSQRIEIEIVSRKWNFLSKCAWTKFHLIDHFALPKSADEETFEVTDKVITGKFMTLLMSRCGKYLTSIKLADKDIILKDVDALWCSNLKTINISNATIDTTSLRSFADNCHQLTSVQFVDCFSSINVDPELTYLFFNCPHLTNIALSNNQKLTGKCLAVLPVNLKHLSLTGCTAMKDKQIRAVADRCKNLELLDMSHCCQLSTDSLNYLCREWTNLQDLRLEKTGVNDDNLQTISLSCTNLNNLDLNHCLDITDTGLISISKLQHLVILDLRMCSKITDNGVKALTKLEYLKYVKLQSQSITDYLVKKLAEFCLNLQTVDLCGCEKVTNESVDAFYNATSDFLWLDVRETNVKIPDADIYAPYLGISY